MTEQLRQLVLDTLLRMNYDPAEIGELGDDTPLGPDGLDLESLALVELGLRVEETHGVPFDDDLMERMATMTLGEFLADTAGRVSSARDGIPVQ